MILLIHGIDQQEFIDKQDQLAKKWNKLLRDGLMGVGATPEEVEEISGSARMLFYADITDPKRKWEKENTKAVGVDLVEATIRNDFELYADTKGPQNTWIAHLIAKWSDSFPIIRDGLIRALAKEAYGYFGNSQIRDELDQRCDEVIGDAHYKIIIGHSFGSAVAYRCLTRNGSLTEHLLTLGSPLGSPFFMSQLRMDNTPTFKKLTSWSDFADPDDIVSYRPIKIRSMFSDYEGLPPSFISNRTIRNPTFNEHSIQGYLAQPLIAGRILSIYRGEV